MVDQFIGIDKPGSNLVGISSGTIGQGANSSSPSFSARSDMGLQGDAGSMARNLNQGERAVVALSEPSPAVSTTGPNNGGVVNSGLVNSNPVGVALAKSGSTGESGATDPSQHSANGPNNALLAEDSANKVQQLLDAYLSGKLSQGELAHKLRVHNSVVADQIIKDGKRAPTSAINYIEVTRATVQNPGGVYPEPPEKTQPKKGLGAGYGPGQPDEDEGKKMREKEEKQDVQQQQRERIEVENTNERDREAKEIQHQHLLAEEERRREEEEELGLGEGLDGLEALARTSFGTFSKVRQAASPNQIRRELAKKELEKQKDQALTESTGASQQDR